MHILGVHFEHDGSLASIVDGTLVRHVEAQKDNQRRYRPLSAESVAGVIAGQDLPDVVAYGGWFDRPGGYFGVAEPQPPVATLADGWELREFVTSHERAHIMCAYGLSPFPEGTPCYALVWEGEIGALYEIDEHLAMRRLGTPLNHPGHRYSFLYELAHTGMPDECDGGAFGAAGKLMALASAPPLDSLDDDDRRLLGHLLSADWNVDRPRKMDVRWSKYFNCGVTAERFRRFARVLSDGLFETFFRSAEQLVSGDKPLLISGGCGLNCDWNARWRSSGLFTDVFIPPCADDSGCAIGAAIDCQRALTGRAKVDWTVYAGDAFVEDCEMPTDVRAEPASARMIAAWLARGAVIAWVQGRYELGPRALGHRSLLAAPFDAAMTQRLNAIKVRESYRPVAPVCLETELHRFTPRMASAYMLELHRVQDARLTAVTHDDGTARIQTVRQEQEPRLFELLTAFQQLTGVGVLCNTSLNFPGRGFINRTSDLLAYVKERRLDAFVVNDRLYYFTEERHPTEEAGVHATTRHLES